MNDNSKISGKSSSKSIQNRNGLRKKQMSAFTWFIRSSSRSSPCFGLMTMLVLIMLLCNPSSSSSSFSSSFSFFAQASEDAQVDLPTETQLFSKQRAQMASFANQNVIEPIRNQYEQLSPNGKFISTAFVGFTTSRVAIRTTIKTTVKVAKVTGAAFIVSEVLHSAGILDYDDLEYYDDTMQQIKSKVTQKVNQCRLMVRKHCNMENLKSKFDHCLQQDKVGTLGFTTGVVAALVL